MLNEIKEIIFFGESPFWKISEKSPLCKRAYPHSLSIDVGPLSELKIAFVVNEKTKDITVNLFEPNRLFPDEGKWVYDKPPLIYRLNSHLDHGEFSDEIFKHLDCAYKRLRAILLNN